MTDTAPDIEVSEVSDVEIQKLKMLAANVQDDTHFRGILQQVNWEMRRAAYNRIKPFLTFKPKPFMRYKFH